MSFNTRFFKQNDDVSATIPLIAYVAEIKEWDNRSHLNRIKAYTSVICSGLNIPKNDITLLSAACQLHDIGKSLTPDVLLKSKGDYTDEEWVIIEKHTIDGAAILGGTQSSIFQTGAVIAATHHERWDGSGYPNKLKGTEIPLIGRICALADVFDALVTVRPYKEIIDDKAAVDIVFESSGILFDPKCVEVFLNKIDEILAIKKTPPIN